MGIIIWCGYELLELIWSSYFGMMLAQLVSQLVSRFWQMSFFISNANAHHSHAFSKGIKYDIYKYTAQLQ